MKHNQQHLNQFTEILYLNFINILIFALFLIPMLIPYSYMPVSKFHSELIAVYLAFLIGVTVLFKSKRIEIPVISIACFMFAVFLLAQILFIPIRLIGINYTVAIEFFVGAIFASGITTFINNKTEIQLQLVKILMYALWLSSLIQVIYGYLQFTGVAQYFNNLILYVDMQSINIFGNIGQKNDYVDFVTMGLFALSYLYYSSHIKKLFYFINVFAYLIIISITTSRTTFTYFILALIILGIFFLINKRNHSERLHIRKVFILLIGLFFALLVIEFLLPKIMLLLTSRDDITSGLYRFDPKTIGQSTYRRFYEWYKDIIIFINHPIMGIGWYQYPKEAIDLMLKDQRFWYIPANTALYTHSHNSPLNILAETGILGFAIIVLYGVCYSVYSIFKNFNNIQTLFVMFVLFTLIGQSFFQYPLWYAYFFMYFILLLSINKSSISFNNSKSLQIFIVIITIIFSGICISATSTYYKLVELAQNPQTEVDYKNNLIALQQIADNEVLWQLPTLTVIDSYIIPGSKILDGVMPLTIQAKYINLLANALPYPGGIFKQIVINKLLGYNEQSLYYANLLAHAFPAFKAQYADQLESASSIVFKNEIQVIRDFKYQDKSIFTNEIFKK